MEGRPLITRVVLENYKSIAFCDVKLGPLAILVGPNGAGKSNFLDALRFLSEATSGPTEKAFQDRGGFKNVVRRNLEFGRHLGFRIEFLTAQGMSGYYSIRFVEDSFADYITEREKCFLLGSEGYEARYSTIIPGNELTNPTFPRQINLLIRAASPSIKPVFDLFQNSRFYNLSPKDFRQPIVAGNGKPRLVADGANLADVVNHLHLQHPEVFERIIQYLQTIYPALTSLETVEFRGYRTLDFLLKENNVSFSPAQMSDGTLRSLAVLVALFQHLGGVSTVSLVGLEEPEVALHPAAAGVLFDAMREASESVQVIATTHSADLLDKKEIDTDAILAVELQGGTTRIGHVDETGRKALKAQLYTPGELMRMNYLRPESSKIPDESEVDSFLFGDPVPA
jgi:predicted ATPase